MQSFVYLASQSPRRRELLERIGVSFEIVDVRVEENPGPDEMPEVFALRMALEKGRAGYRQIGASRDAPVIGADTVVVLEDEILGKPRDAEHGREMLRRLGGATHRVVTAVALVDDREDTRLSVSQVALRRLSEDEVQCYWDSGEPVDKAGAYAIQGRGGVFVEHLEGNYTGVMGLPLYETTQLLDEFNVSWLDGWR